MTKGTVYSIEGGKVREIDLPSVFETEYRPDLIKRAALVVQSRKKQAKGADPMAGRKNTAMYQGSRKKPAPHKIINSGVARKRHLKNRRFLLYGQVAGFPGTKGGPDAHPPQAKEIYWESINIKEKKLAIKSAIAATGNKIIVFGRGSHIPTDLHLPIIIEDKFEELERTKDVEMVLEKMNLLEQVERAKGAKKVRAGKGTKRNRQYKRKKSLLIVTSKKSKLLNAAKNLEGVQICEARNLNADLLAPGTKAGRLTIYSEGAIKQLKG